MLPKAKYLKNVFSLDFGTTKFCLARLREVALSNTFTVETVSVPAEGMRRGMLCNMGEAKAALKQLIETAESEFGCDIGRVVVGVAGSHLGSRVASVSCSIKGEVVGRHDMLGLMQQVEADNPVPGRELLHTVPVGYRVDSREVVDEPRGFRGQVLHGTFFLIDADQQYLKDLIEVCNDSGLQVERLYSEPFASASVTVPDAYKQIGVALADIGGGTTDGIVFKGGRPIDSFTVNVAGKLMTSDLAIGLSLSQEEAERVKLRFGIKARDGDLMDVTDIRGQKRSLGEVQVNAILKPRIHELCLLLSRELLPHRSGLGAGLLLTGGGADLIGITDYVQAKLSLSVARARPLLKDDLEAHVAAAGVLGQSLYPPKFATVIGLLNLELGRMDDLEKTRKTSWTSRYLGQFVNWIKELS